MSVFYLEPDDIRDIHDVMLERYGGKPGENESGLIDYMASKPAMELFGREQFPDLFTKAAVYMHGFATNQFFCDGNKRTAYGCMTNFLELNGYMIVVDDDELYDMAMAVANGHMDIEDIAKWIAQNCIPVLYT